MNVNQWKLIWIGFLLIILISVSAQAAEPVLTVQNATATNLETIGIKVKLNDTSNISAIVFKLTYDPVEFSLVSVNDPASFFDVFDKNDDQNGNITFCGAKKTAQELSDIPVIIFNFKVSGTASFDHSFRIEQSEVTFLDAGYPATTSLQVLTKPGPEYGELSTDISTSVGKLSIDKDDDGLTDTQEGIVGTDIGDPDPDGDGIFDAFEDADSDGHSNLKEFLKGSDPMSGSSTPGLIGNVDGDNDTDGKDLYILITELGSSCSYTLPCQCDLNIDDTVDQVDFKLLVEDFGKIGN